MTRIYIYLLIAVLPILSCLKGKATFSHSSSIDKDSTIVFFDIRQYTRTELSQFIKIIDEFEPKIIALSVVFDSLKDPREDSLLALSISNAGNVVLAASIRNSDLAIVGSHPLFTNSALGEGVLSQLIGDDSVATEYIPLFENDDRQMLSFPNQIVFHYRPSTIERFANLRVNEQVNIYYSKTLEDFYILDSDHLEPELVKNKIVIFGSFEPDSKYYSILIKGNSPIKTYSIVVTANIILNLLRKSE